MDRQVVVMQVEKVALKGIGDTLAECIG